MTGAVRLSLVDNQLRHFKLSLQALAKIGTDLLIEALPNRLVLRCINPTRSAYLSLTFHARYFDAYDIFHSDVVQAGVLMKQLLSVFRTQRINRLNLELGFGGDWLEVVIFCDSGLRKTYRMRTTEAEILQASVDRAAFPITLVAEPQSMTRLLASFQGGLEEVTLVAFPPSATQTTGAVQLHSHADPQKDQGHGALVTKLAVDARRSFLEYQHSTDGVRSVTFNVKDFRAILSFCEHLGRPLVLRMEGPGLPLMIEPGGGEGAELEAQLVLATLMEGADGMTQPTADSAPTTQQHHGRAGEPGDQYDRVSSGGWEAAQAFDRWAVDNPAISELFAEDAKMLTQDRQNLQGRPAILKQFEKGVGLLIKMGGKSEEVPVVTLDGPTRDPGGAHVMKCTMKRGGRTISFTLEFHIMGGKIKYLKNTRS